MIVAVPMPPPMHSVTSAVDLLVRSSSSSTVPSIMAPVAPSGVAVGQPNADELYLRPGDDMVISFEGLMSLRTRIVGPK